MNDPCNQSDAEIDKALGQDWPAKRGVTADESDLYAEILSIGIECPPDEIRKRVVERLREYVIKDRTALIAHLKSEAQIHEKASDAWKVASDAQVSYHTGAVHQCQAIIDHIERLP